MKILESPNPFGESPKGLILAFCFSVLSPERNKIGGEKKQIEQDGDETYQRADRRVDQRSRLTTPNDPLQHKSLKTINTFVVELNEIVVANTISPLCFRLARERSRKTKTTKLMASGIGSTLGSTRETRESEWTKVEVVPHAATRSLRETELIRDSTPTLG
ncbi:hypothetical protein H5410_002901 [Solanum commersonii]|uniref:Uncharacterized protein n=1 Tax=Solanum commersonii TaxID=4109 RepID=A0A9J6B3H8_SOLCO|nr:hypothetical protein H5410_002901 [Solanum commersonii]